MRCYFLKGKRIEGVELLTATTDAEMIKEAEALFDARSSDHIDGFEVWDTRRFVYRFSKEPEKRDQ